MKKAPAQIVDGRVTEVASLRNGDEVKEVLVPVTWAEGRDRGGIGAVTVAGGLIVVQHSYYESFMVATTGIDSEWRNYGAPHGRHVRVNVEWAALPGAPTSGVGGWVTACGKFITRDEAYEIARRLAAEHYAAAAV